MSTSRASASKHSCRAAITRGSPLENDAGITHARHMSWTVYIILCEDDTLYTGITTDLERRFREHREKSARAKYFNGRKALRVVYAEPAATRSEASRREAEIKKL